MTRDLAPHTLDAYVDGELELAAQLELEALLAQDADLRQQAEQLQLLRRAIQTGADYHAAPPDLRERWLDLAALAQPPDAVAQPADAPAPAANRSRARTAAGVRRSGAVGGRWFAWRPWALSLTCALLLGAGIGLAGRSASPQADLMQQAIASHVRATLGQREIDVATSDRHAVKPWLSARLDFSPTVPDLSAAGVELLGGRLDYLDNRPVATVVYQRRQHVIDAFVWPRDEADTLPAYASQRGFNIVHWTRGGMRHCLVSDLNAQELGDVARALYIALASN